jgi:AcrR family transcriptional regulator
MLSYIWQSVARERILVLVPRLWSETIETHRQSVREAILETTAALASEQGVRAVTMSQIAEHVGIGRATLYKYFPDVDAILVAWHERQVSAHLGELTELRDQTRGARARLEAVLHALARIHHKRAKRERDHTEIAALVHQDEHVRRAEDRLRGFLGELLSDCAAAGEIRVDVAPDELAGYCLNALQAATTLPSKAAVVRLVEVTLAGLDG